MIARWAWGAGILLALAIIGLVGYALRDSLFPIFLGFGLAYAFDPLADWLESHRVGRTAAVCLIMAGVAAAAALALALVVPPLVTDATEFAARFPEYAELAAAR